jgi:hypothetical protein
MATAFPATVIVPERKAPLVFAATAYSTVPLPSPLAPDVMEIKPLALSTEAVQRHPAATLTARVAVPPAAPKERPGWLTV